MNREEEKKKKERPPNSKTARTEQVAVPGEGADAVLVARQRARLCGFWCVLVS
jgi:hypothetical protein